MPVNGAAGGRHSPRDGGGRRKRHVAAPFVVGAAAALCLSARGGAQAAARPYSMDQVAEAVATGLGTRMLEQARVNCVAFVVDATAERRLRAAGAEPDFTTALRDVCYRGTSIQVTTRPAGAEVWVQERRVGTTPWASPMRPARNTVVEVRLGGQWRLVTVDVVADSLVSISLDMPRDTVALPGAPSENEIRLLRSQAAGFNPRSRPTAPTPPQSRGRSVTSTIVGGLLGAAAGVGAGTLLCRQDVVRYRSEEFGGGTIYIQDGTDTELRSGCVGVSIGLGAAGGGVAGNLWAGSGTGRRRRRYDEDRRLYERQLARWDEQRRAAERLQQYELRRAERDSLVAQNQRIKAENRTIATARVRVEPPARLARAVLNYSEQ